MRDNAQGIEAYNTNYITLHTSNNGDYNPLCKC